MQPEDTHDWQQCVAAVQAETDPGVVDAAILALRPLIEETAERVCQRLRVNERVRHEFVSGSVADIIFLPRSSKPPRIADYDPEKGAVPDWLKTTLRNLLIDQLRKASRQGKHEQQMPLDEDGNTTIEAIADSDQHNLGAVLDKTAPFSDHDLSEISNLPSLTRLLLLTVLDWWQKVPSTTWRSWYLEEGLPEPFPPEPHVRRKRADWINLLAEKLSVTPTMLQMKFKRGCDKLIEDHSLEYIWGKQRGK